MSQADIKANNIDLEEGIVLHWNGRSKPWESDSELDDGLREPFRKMYEDELELGKLEIAMNSSISLRAEMGTQPAELGMPRTMIPQMAIVPRGAVDCVMDDNVADA